MFGFKANPKQRAENHARKLYNKATSVQVRGRRIRDAADAPEGVPVGAFFAECVVDGQVVAKALTRGADWRKAYRLLVDEVTKVHQNATQPAPV